MQLFAADHNQPRVLLGIEKKSGWSKTTISCLFLFALSTIALSTAVLLHYLPEAETGVIATSSVLTGLTLLALLNLALSSCKKKNNAKEL